MLRRLVTASAEKCRCWKSDEVVSAAALLDNGERWWNKGFVWSLGSCRRRDAVAMVPIGANAECSGGILVKSESAKNLCVMCGGGESERAAQSIFLWCTDRPNKNG